MPWAVWRVGGKTVARRRQGLELEATAASVTLRADPQVVMVKSTEE